MSTKTVEKLDALTAMVILEEIPEERWCMYTTHFGRKRCAIGHLNEFFTGSPNITTTIVNAFVFETRRKVQSITIVNDDLSFTYRQPTPKERVMAFLDHCVEKGL